MVFAGAIAKQVLSLYNVYVGAHIYRINDVADEKFNPISVSKNDIELITKKDFPVIDDSKTEQMKAKILEAKENLNSVGGIVECAVIGIACW